MSLKGKSIIVTGGTSGIGEGCTRHFAELGAKVVTASIQQEEGVALQDELCAAGGDVTFVYCDMTDEEQVAGLVSRAVELHGRVDGVCSNAGAWIEGTVEDFDDRAWNLVMGVNVRGNFLLAKYSCRFSASRARASSPSPPRPPPTSGFLPTRSTAPASPRCSR